MGYTTINNNVALKLASATIREAVAMDVVHINGKGINAKYTQGDVLRAHSIDIPFIKLASADFRAYGATTNGGGFNAKTDDATSGFHTVPLNYIYDVPCKIADITNDEAGGDLFKSKVEAIGKQVALGINALTFAAQISKCLNASQADSATYYVTQSASNNDAYANYVEANTALDDGDPDVGFYYFDADFRQAFVTPAFYTELKQSRAIIDSNYGQLIKATGLLNPFEVSADSKIELRTGYKGMLDGVMMYNLPKATLQYAAENCSSTATGFGKTSFDSIKGLIVAGEATFGGFMEGNYKIVDAQGGQGIEIQPKIKGGVECISGKSVRLIVANGFTNPVTKSSEAISVVPKGSKA